MKRRIVSAWVCSVLSLVVFGSNSASSASVQLRVVTVRDSSLTGVSIQGIGKEFSGWSNGVVPMERETDSSWTKSLRFPAGTHLLFKFSRGSWSTVGLDSIGGEQTAISFVLERDTEITRFVRKWRNDVDGHFNLSADRFVSDELVYIGPTWLYRSGDDSAWSSPALNDRGWENANVLMPSSEQPKSGWTGIGWFRMHVTVDSLLRNQSFAMYFREPGAAEIFLDGRLLYAFGQVGTTSQTEVEGESHNPFVITFDGRPSHVIAVRYSNHNGEKFAKVNIGGGFDLRLGKLNAAIQSRAREIRATSITQMIFTCVTLTLGIFHFMLFIFYPRAKENLFYAFAMTGFAYLSFSAYQSAFYTSGEEVYLVSMWRPVAADFTIISGLLSFYIVRFKQVPIQGYILVAIGIVLIPADFIMSPGVLGYATDGYTAAAVIEMMWRFGAWGKQRRTVERQEGRIWIAKIGFLILPVLVGYDLLTGYDIITPMYGITGTSLYGALFLAFYMSLYLSQKFARTNKDLELQLIQVKELSAQALEQERKRREVETERKLLEAENARKSEELEGARKLQLSMLPQTLPSVPGLEIAAFMKTATEVGGDYYDFVAGEGGQLTLAIGDATGHGVKAGMMVAVTKSLFHELAPTGDFPSAFAHFTRAIKNMRLGQMYMSLLLARFEGRKLSLSAAGMPAPVVYRASTRAVEELLTRGMPLGSVEKFPYQVVETQLAAGDVVVFMSDGITEMFNPREEMFDMAGVKRYLAGAGDKSASEIIEGLMTSAESWAEGFAQQDDVTLVVAKLVEQK